MSSSTRKAEATLQRLCVKELRAEFPGVVCYRHSAGDRLRNPRHYRLRKLEGETLGAPDLCVLLPGAGGPVLLVEFKTEGQRLNSDQAATHRRLVADEYAPAVVRTLEEFWRVVDGHVGRPSLLRRSRRVGWATEPAAAGVDPSGIRDTGVWDANGSLPLPSEEYDDDDDDDDDDDEEIFWGWGDEEGMGTEEDEADETADMTADVAAGLEAMGVAAFEAARPEVIDLISDDESC